MRIHRAFDIAKDCFLLPQGGDVNARVQGNAWRCMTRFSRPD